MGYQTEVRPFSVGPYQVGSGQPLLLIAGPCVLENDELCLEIARKVQAIGSRCGMNVVFKGSFDKANRTSGSAFRGLGMEAGLRDPRSRRRRDRTPVTTDIHESYQAAPGAESATFCRFRVSREGKPTCWSRRLEPSGRCM
ncbi:MAG: hypothetical protein R3B96_13060 [Pirellulaceae bacterium]